MANVFGKMGVIDSHACLTDAETVLFVIYILGEDKTCVTPILIPQIKGTVTYFWGSSQIHGAVDGYTWYQLIGRYTNFADANEESAFMARMKHCGHSAPMRVWLSTYGRQPMYEVAKLARKYEESGSDPETYSIVCGLGSDQLQDWVESLKTKRRRKKHCLN